MDIRYVLTVESARGNKYTFTYPDLWSYRAAVIKAKNSVFLTVLTSQVSL
jgi:hypothetical protein